MDRPVAGDSSMAAQRRIETNGAIQQSPHSSQTQFLPIFCPSCPHHYHSSHPCPSLSHSFSVVGGVAQWLGRRSLAGGLSLPCARFVVNRRSLVTLVVRVARVVTSVSRHAVRQARHSTSRIFFCAKMHGLGSVSCRVATSGIWA